MAWYLLVGLGAVSGGLLTIFYSYPPVSSQDWASWVQAVGSIAAIFFAWLIGKSQLRTQDRQRAIDKHEEVVAQSETCEILAEQAAIVLKNIITKFEGPDGRFELIGVERIKELQHSLRLLSSKNIPSRLFTHLLPIQRELAYTLTAVRQYNDDGHAASPDRIKNASTRLSIVLNTQAEIKQISKQLKSKKIKTGGNYQWN